MSERAARVRLELSNGGFLNDLKNTTDKTVAAGRAMNQAFSRAGTAGFGAMKESLAGIAGEAKSAARWGVTLGGSLALGSAANTAVGLVDKYKNLAFAIKAGTGEAVKFESIQQDVEDSARRLGRANDEVADTMSGLYADTGDLEYARVAMEAVGVAANDTGKSTDALAGIAGHLFEKFGVGKENIKESLAAMVGFANRGGLSIEDFSERLGMLGASAKIAGLSGSDGLHRVVAMVNTADDSLGNMGQKIKAVTGLLDELGDPAKLKGFEKQLKLSGKLVGKDGKAKSDALETILVKTGGDPQKLANLFSGAGGKLAASFGEMYAGGAKEGGKAGGIQAFHDALAEAGKSSLDYATMEEDSMRRIKGPKQQLQIAMNELSGAMSKPEMIDAMTQMAQLAPKIANGFAKLVGAGVNNPIKAAGAYVIGRPLLEGAAKATGTLAADWFSKQLAKDTVWAKAGKSVGVAAAAVIAYEVGKSIIDATMTGNKDEVEKEIAGINIVSRAHGEARAGGLSKETRTALVKEQAQIMKERAEREQARNMPQVGSGAMGFGGIPAKRTETKEEASERQRSADRLAEVSRLLSGELTVRVSNWVSAPGSNGLPPPFRMDQE